MQSTVLSYQQSEVQAARRRDAMREQAAACGKGHHVVGIVEEPGVETRLRQHLPRIPPKAPQHFRQAHGRADAKHRLRRVQTCSLRRHFAQTPGR